MKIALVTRYFPSSGEPWQGRSAYQTVRVLSKLAEVKVFYPHPQYPRLLRPRTRLYGGLDGSFAPAGVDTVYHDFPALPLISRPTNGLMAARTLLPHVREFLPDVIFSIFLYPDAYAGMLISQRLGVPMVAMGIGSDVHSIGDRLSAMLTRKVLRQSDFVVTVSEDLRQKAIELGASAERSRSVVNGCDLSVFHPRDKGEARKTLKLDPDAETIVYIGRMHIKKGLRELVRAAAALHSRRPRLQVHMVGEGADRPEIRAEIEKHGANAYVHELPACTPDEVPVWMAAADTVTLPSYMEGCPNAVLEALACGRPVVATNVGGIPEIMSEECGRLIPPRDSAALAEALDQVLGAAWDAEEISSHWGRSWDSVAKELMEIFESVGALRKATVHG